MFFILAICTCQEASRKVLEASMAERHEQWMLRYGKVYNDAAEKERRFNIFRENVEFIESFNADGRPNRPRSYKLSINEFADQTNQEFKAYR
ncbi:hypothetical protein L484_004796 [Morus notabilis]|uniref:Cathepsin propeptide inhibitor domain-containing protein n=1 Tax=Morus notabilis TaxID=981085 RepID=W9RKA6_9ROSA|nr:hypothetical protein L484_004796 [Morus notabilis]